MAIFADKSQKINPSLVNVFIYKLSNFCKSLVFNESVEFNEDFGKRIGNKERLLTPWGHTYVKHNFIIIIMILNVETDNENTSVNKKNKVGV